MPKLDLDTGLLAQLPPWYRRILDYQEICRTETAQMEALATEISAVARNFFFQTMDQSAVAQWESVFGIIPDPSIEGLEFRRARIRNRVSTRPPYTMRFLEQKLDELIGPDAWTVRMDYPNYTLYIESSARNQLYAAEVAHTIGRIKPAHIVYVNTPYEQTGLLLSEEIQLARRVYNYRLGAWGLGTGPFASEASKGAIKLPSVPSVQPALLEQTAAFVADDIAAARINGTVMITALTKAAEGSALTVTYDVTAAQADEITRVELLDAAGAVLTASAVYIPVTGSTIMKHIIPVQEGVLNNGAKSR
ncbi:MAG: DUF2313 domain-containing protein [Oscillospiraceae bacterium]|nr:DUF2313 domain-containing protein [Oscillospiraceae bacterium]